MRLRPGTVVVITYVDGRREEQVSPPDVAASLDLLAAIQAERVVSMELASGQPWASALVDETAHGEPNEEAPENRLQATAYVVGPGIRQAMASWKDAPAMDELPLTWLGQTVFNICLGVNGRLYAWEAKSNTVHVIG